MVSSKLLRILGNIRRFSVTCSLWGGGRGHLSTSRYLVMDDTVQLAFSAGDARPERLSFPRILLNTMV